VHSPEIVVPLGFFTMMTLMVVGLPLVRGLVRRWEREGAHPRVPSEVNARLERMEQSIDAIAVEVERIAEGQRFVTKLLADRPAPARLPESAAESARPGR
jgi:hypothetical protein